jgi:hypothetical protein
VSLRLLNKDAKTDCFSSAKMLDEECMKRLPTVQIIKAWIDWDLHDNDPVAQRLLDVLTLQEQQINGKVCLENIDSGISLLLTYTKSLTIRVGLSRQALHRTCQ